MAERDSVARLLEQQHEVLIAKWHEERELQNAGGSRPQRNAPMTWVTEGSDAASTPQAMFKEPVSPSAKEGVLAKRSS
eukprot:9513107-Heterocapsa_arctica.AAC.1